MPKEILTPEQKDILEYEGEETLEALATLDTYMKQCCNTSATSRKLNKNYNRVRKYLNQPYVRDIFKLKLLQKGVTPEKIAQTIAEGLEASNGVYSEGAHIADEPNWASRHKFVQLAAEIFEVLKYQAKENNTTNVNLSFTNIKQMIEYVNQKGRPEISSARLSESMEG